VGWGVIGYFWMLRMSAQAQWGGLAPEQRAWIFYPAQVGTALVSELQGGVPGDLAWSEVYRRMSLEDRTFAARMGSTLWSAPSVVRSRPGMLEILERAIEDQRRILAHAVLEGRSSAESLERLLDQVQEEIRGELSRGIRRLGTRALLPLFLCVAPGFFILLAGAILLGGVLG
jgi:Flp pilus assembly protein TadB